MTIQSLGPMLAAASAGSYAVAQFNTDTLEIAQAVVQAATECRAPVVLAVGQGIDRVGRMEPLAAGLRVMAEGASVPVCLHLDHSESLPQIRRALMAGFSGIMIDASALPLAENIAETRQVMELCRGLGVGVEAELGRVAGVEDDLEVREEDAGRVDLVTVSAFLAQVRPDALAVAVGTSHGSYRHPPKIDFRMLSEARDAGSPPLVLHGGSGLSDAALREAVACGIAKLNFATDLRKVYLNAFVQASASEAGLLNVIEEALQGVRQFASLKMAVGGSAGKAARP